MSIINNTDKVVFPLTMPIDANTMELKIDDQLIFIPVCKDENIIVDENKVTACGQIFTIKKKSYFFFYVILILFLFALYYAFTLNVFVFKR